MILLLLELIEAFLNFVFMVLLSMLAMLYLVYSTAIHRLAKIRAVKHSWLAFVPVARYYILGAMADDIRARKGKVGHSRHTLTVVALGLTIATCFSWGGSGELSVVTEGFSALLFLILMVAEILALYHIYREYRPKYAVLFTVFSAIPGMHLITKAIFLMTVGQPPNTQNQDAAAEHVSIGDQP